MGVSDLRSEESIPAWSFISLEFTERDPKLSRQRVSDAYECNQDMLEQTMSVRALSLRCFSSSSFPISRLHIIMAAFGGFLCKAVPLNACRIMHKKVIIM
jgi:hypothetical protein